MKATAPLYIALANLCQRYQNLEERPIVVRPDLADHCRSEALRLVREHMPSGSGFDSGTAIEVDDCDDQRLIFQTAFHHMNEGGYYDGWTTHRVRAVAVFGGFDLVVGGHNRNGIKDYVHETFYQALQQEVTYQVLPAASERAA